MVFFFLYHTYKTVSDVNPFFYGNLCCSITVSKGVGDAPAQCPPEQPDPIPLPRFAPAWDCGHSAGMAGALVVPAALGSCPRPPGHRVCPAAGCSSGLPSPALLRGAAEVRAVHKPSPCAGSGSSQDIRAGFIFSPKGTVSAPKYVYSSYPSTGVNRGIGWASITETLHYKKTYTSQNCFLLKLNYVYLS